MSMLNKMINATNAELNMLYSSRGNSQVGKYCNLIVQGNDSVHFCLFCVLVKKFGIYANHTHTDFDTHYKGREALCTA